jgi:hypothetical protein
LWFSGALMPQSGWANNMESALNGGSSQSRRETPMSNPITIEVNGQSVNGRYTVRGGMITVSTIHGSKTTQVGNMNTEALAKMLLRELVEEGKGP